MITETDTIVWYGTQESAQQFLQRQAERAGKEPSDIEIKAYADLYSEDRFGIYEEFVATHGDVAVIAVSGSLGYKEDWWSVRSREMTYETLSNILSMVVNDGEIKHVMLDIDSPGGLAKGVDLATDAIKLTQEAGIDVTAFTQSEMCSAAYRIGSAASPVIAAKNSEVGSIGVISVHADMSKFYEEMGIKLTVFRKGDEKALASPYEPLSAKAKEAIDRRMQVSYDAFVETVAENRGLSVEHVRSNLATGRVFTAQEAVDNGLVDKIATFTETFAGLTTQSSSNQPGVIAMAKTPVITMEAPAGLEQTAEDLAVAAAAGLTEPEPQAEADVVVVDNPPADPEQSEPAPQPAPAPQQQDAGMLTMLGNLNDQLVETRVKLQAAETSLSEMKANQVGLRQIVVEQTENMRVRLGMPAGTDLESMADGALVATYQTVRNEFVTRFRTGPQSRVPEQDTPLPTASVTRLDQARLKATTIGK